MDSSSFPTTAQVRQAHPGELAVLMSTVTGDVLAGLSLEQAEAVVVATQRVASWAHGVQAMAVDRFAEHVLDAQEARAADLAAAREAQRASVEARGGTWRGESGAVGMPEPEQVAASMLAPELRISPRTMRTRLARARALMELPHTLGLALAGDLEPWRVDAVVVASQDVAADRLVELECRLYAADVIDLPKPRLVERVRRAAAKADPEAVTRGVRRAPRRRSLRVTPSETDGLMRWSLEVPDELSRRMFAAVDDLAQEYLTADRVGAAGRGSPQPRTVEAARVDALGDLVMANAHVETVIELVVPLDVGAATTVTRSTRRAAATAELTRTRPRPGPHGSPAHDPAGSRVEDVAVDEVAVDLVLGSVTRETLAAGEVERRLGLLLGARLEVAANPFLTRHPPTPAEPPRRRRRRAEPGTRVGDADPPPWPSTDRVWFVDGLVEAPGAAALVPEQITALLDHPDTRVRIRGSTCGTADGDTRRRRTYRPGAALARAVRARDRHCRFPGCSVPANRCHLDHVIAFPSGETVEGNLQTLCPAHHGFKHHAGWGVTMTDDGTCHWTTPAGRTHTTVPAALRDRAA